VTCDARQRDSVKQVLVTLVKHTIGTNRAIRERAGTGLRRHTGHGPVAKAGPRGPAGTSGYAVGARQVPLSGLSRR
jgi:hypothetical protein